MTARRLIPATHVESWEADLRKAVHTAFDVQRASVHRSMAQQPSAPASLTAAGRRKKRAVPLAIGGAVWSDQAWTKLVNQHVAPVAKKVANDAMTVAKLSVAAALTWGVASSAAAVSAAIVSAAIASGVAIGKRLNDAFQTADDPDTAVGDVLDTAPDIMEDLVGAMATTAASSATNDVTSYVAGYFGNVYSGATRSWNCITVDTLVSAHAATDIARRYHIGTVVRLQTLSGGVLSVTPEHLLLTDRGWRRAGELDPGDHLVRYGLSERMIRTCPDIEDPQSSIEKHFLTGQKARPGSRVVRRVMDFDGHGQYCEIDVISVDGELRNDLESSLGQPDAQLILSLSDVSIDVLSANGAITNGLSRPPLATAFDGPLAMRGHSQISISFPSQTVSLRQGPRINGGSMESVPDDSLANPHLDGDLMSRSTGEIAFRNELGSDVMELACRYAEALSRSRLSNGVRIVREAQTSGIPDATERNACGDKSAFDGHGADGLRASDLLDAFARLVTTDEVVKVERDIRYSGHVYDLSTGSKWFLANSFIIHNSQGDDKVREAHQDVDDVGLNEPFIVGGEAMTGPGDTSASEELWCNCRCWVEVTGIDPADADTSEGEAA